MPGLDCGARNCLQFQYSYSTNSFMLIIVNYDALTLPVCAPTCVHPHSHVDSALSRFLLRRALTKPRLIGHIYYWLLQSEVYNADVSKRYVILLQVSP